MYSYTSDTQVAKFQLFGSLLILTGYRLFLILTAKSRKFPYKLGGSNCPKNCLLETFLSKRPRTILLTPLRTVAPWKL